jgi:hypothetical protein
VRVQSDWLLEQVEERLKSEIKKISTFFLSKDPSPIFYYLLRFILYHICTTKCIIQKSLFITF